MQKIKNWLKKRDDDSKNEDERKGNRSLSGSGSGSGHGSRSGSAHGSPSGSLRGANLGGSQRGSPEELRRSREIEQFLREDETERSSRNRLLVLGASGVGKSTLFKQMLILYGDGINIQTKVTTSAIYKNCIRAIQIVSDLTERYFEEGPKKKNSKLLKKKISHLGNDTIIDDLLAAQIYNLWTDPNVQWTYKKETARGEGALDTTDGKESETFNNLLSTRLHVCLSKFFPKELENLVFLYVRERVIPDSCEYFLNRIAEIGKHDYIPTQDDILHARVKTSGIVESKFTIDRNHFELVDVAGQRNERKKWISQFENVLCVIFVSDLSGYSAFLYEDVAVTNRLHEDLNLFENICNSRWFRDTSLLLFLNKSDIFRDRFNTIPLTRCFPEYTGANTFEACVPYIEAEFLKRNHYKKPIYCHVTCATDTGVAAAVFNAAKDVIIRTALDKAGLV